MASSKKRWTPRLPPRASLMMRATTPTTKMRTSSRTKAAEMTRSRSAGSGAGGRLRARPCDGRALAAPALTRPGDLRLVGAAATQGAAGVPRTFLQRPRPLTRSRRRRVHLHVGERCVRVGGCQNVTEPSEGQFVESHESSSAPGPWVRLSSTPRALVSPLGPGSAPCLQPTSHVTPSLSSSSAAS